MRTWDSSTVRNFYNMGMRAPLRFENLKGLESGWTRPLSFGEILVMVFILAGIVFLIYELRK